ncbi:MAG: hypothetical protein R2932_54595 [Caldilineaceae bacterium]
MTAKKFARQWRMVLASLVVLVLLVGCQAAAPATDAGGGGEAAADSGAAPAAADAPELPDVPRSDADRNGRRTQSVRPIR